MMNEFIMRFLIVGTIITILIGFGVWWFFIHSSSDRIVEENGAKFVKAVYAACETNQPVYVDFQMPQPFVASLKEKTEEFFNWVSQKIGLGGPEINIPVQTFNDPYYKIYWEYFPPEPPYSFGQGVLETAASIFAPWSEDLPWTSNFMSTLVIDSFTLGLDTFGLGKIFPKGKAAAGWLVDKFKRVSPTTFEKLTKIWNAIENGADIVVENVGKAERIVIKSGKLVIREGKFVGKFTAVYTALCLVIQDKTLGDCLEEGVILSIGADAAKVITSKYVYPKLKSKLEAKIQQIKTKFSIKLEEFKQMFSSSIDEIADEDVIPSLKESIGDKGWRYDESLKKFIASSEDEIAKENVINPLEEYASQKGYPSRIDDFDIVYKYDEQGKIKGIKEVVYDPKTFKERIKERILYPIEEKLGKLSEKIMSDRMLDSASFKEFSEFAKDYFERNPDKAQEFLRLSGIKVKDSDEAVRILSQRFSNLARQVEEGGLFVVVERGSKMERLIDNLDNIKLSSSDVWRDSRHAVREYLYNIVESGNKEEARNLWNLLNGKRLRIKEEIEVFSRGTFGYMILRIQDLYTPLGATYWDRYFSYYGYPSLEAQKKGFCQTQCDDGKICVQLGACVRQFELPESCVNKGINSIKLKRDSLVAKDPRFYLVSPCYAKLKIYVNGDTLYVEPYMKIDDKKNYCYATAGLVNWYVGSEVTAYAARCLSASVCAAVSGGIGILDAVLACFGLGKGFTGVCSIVSNLVGLIVDIFRDVILIYPDVYKIMPNLIDFKL